MLTILEILFISVNIPVLIWALLPFRRVPRFLDFMPSAAIVFMILHLYIDKEAVPLRFIPLYIFTISVFLITLTRVFNHNPNQPKKRIPAAIGRITSLLVLAACIGVPTVVLPLLPLPQSTGSFNVGTVNSSFTDKYRIEVFSDEPGKSREIAVQFWYPTDKAVSIQTEINGAPVSDLQQSYPVLIFSHGAFGVRMSNASTFRELASHGYIVVSIDHTYHSFYTSFADGRKLTISPKFLNEVMGAMENRLSAEENFKVAHDWLKIRTDDIELVIDSLKAGNMAGESALLNGHMDLSSIGLFGHSLGGAAAAQVCRERDDVKAAIVIDGTMIGDITALNGENKEIITDESFYKPLMLMYNSSYQTAEGKAESYAPNISAYNKAAKAAYALCIKDSGHLNFTDLPRISPFLSAMLGVGKVDALDCIKIVNDYSLAFFDQHIKGYKSTLLNDNSKYKEVEFDKKVPLGAEF